MKFLADMGISPKTVDHLQSLGHDAVHLHAEGLDRLPDSDILQKACDERRVLLTHDLDFGELIAASEARTPSVVIFRLRNMRPKQVNHYLHGILSQHQNVLERGAVVSVSEGQIRIRTLPIIANE
jgi:predicted nuclease of predicted toxin-antitoxin system